MIILNTKRFFIEQKNMFCPSYSTLKILLKINYFQQSRTVAPKGFLGQEHATGRERLCFENTFFAVIGWDLWQHIFSNFKGLLTIRLKYNPQFCFHISSIGARLRIITTCVWKSCVWDWTKSSWFGKSSSLVFVTFWVLMKKKLSCLYFAQRCE